MSTSSWYWRAAAAAAGVLLWLQTGARPAAIELLSGDPSGLYLTVDLAPLVAVLAAALYPRPGAWLFAVPVSFVPLLVSLPARDAAALATPLRMVGLGASLLTLSGTALAASGRVPGLDALWRSFGHREGRRPVGLYPWYVAPRISFVAGSFIILCVGPVSAIPVDGGGSARVFVSVVGVFVWSVVTFTVVVGPLAGIEYRVRNLEQALDSPAGRRGIRWRILVWGGLAAVGGAVAVTVGWLP